jgi:glycosyltransferase involved in cell wall biosynthesis
VLTNDGSSVDKVALSLGIPEDKIAFLVNGIDKDLPKRADSSLRKRITPGGERIVLFIGRLYPYDQPELLIRAIPRIIEAHPDVLFVFVGDGPDRKALEHLSDELEVSRFVRFTGVVPHEDIASYLCASDIFVSLNNHKEQGNIPNSLIEAMCCAKAVIVIAKETRQNMLVGGETCLLLNEEEVGRLPNLVIQLLGDRNLCNRIGGNAREYILNHWPSWEDRVSTEVDIAESLVYVGQER